MATVGTESVEVVPDARKFAAQLRAQLANLPTVVIDVDNADALAKIAELEAALRGIQNRTITISDNGSSSNVSSKIRDIGLAAGVAQAGVALKVTGIIAALAAVIPIAAAASAAVAGIGLGLGIGALAIGVGALALGGIGGALSAGGGSGAAQSSQQQAQAVNQQRQAEVGLTVAQRSAAQAQRDLTQARLDAATALQNLTNQVTDNQLAQRQATLDLATAQQNLTTAKASPDAQNPANAGALAQVQLAFDQAKQHLTELQQAGTQLATQQTAATAAGIVGAAGVVAAQNQVIDTQNALVQAQFQVTDSAQKAADATGSYGAALAKLNPAQQAFTEFLQSVEPIFSQLKTAATNSFLPLLEQAIKDFLPAVGPISTVISTIGTAFGDLAIQAAKFFTSPVFNDFLTFLNQFLGPAIAQFGEIFGNLFKAGIAGFEAFSPVLTQVGDIFVKLSDDLAKALQGGALDGLISFIETSLPAVGPVLSAVFGAISSVLQALAPAATPALSIIQQLADGISQLAPVVGPLVALFLSLVNDALTPLIPQLIVVVKQLVPPLETLLKAIVPVAGQLVSAFLDLVVALLPLVPVIAQLITDLLPPLIGFIDDLIKQGIAPLAEQIAQTLAPLLPQLALSFQQILDALTPLIPQLTAVAIQFLQQIGPDLPEIVKNFGDLAVNLLNLLNALLPILTPLTTFVTTLMTQNNLTLLSGISKSASDLVIALTDLAKGDFGGALKNLGKFFEDLYDFTLKPIVDAINVIKNFVGGQAAGSYTIPGAASGGAGSPHRAAGGPVFAGQTYKVGESGWETFVAQQDGYIVNHADSVRAESRSGSTFNIWTEDPTAAAYMVERRLQFAGA